MHRRRASVVAEGSGRLERREPLKDLGFAGVERGSRRSQSPLNIYCKRMRATAHAPRAYALALWATGDTRAVEGHVRSMTATCLLDCVRFDVVGALEDTADFARRMRGEGGEGIVATDGLPALALAARGGVAIERSDV